jgi:hypothetical protein
MGGQMIPVNTAMRSPVLCCVHYHGCSHATVPMPSPVRKWGSSSSAPVSVVPISITHPSASPHHTVTGVKVWIRYTREAAVDFIMRKETGFSMPLHRILTGGPGTMAGASCGTHTEAHALCPALQPSGLPCHDCQ